MAGKDETAAPPSMQAAAEWPPSKIQERWRGAASLPGALSSAQYLARGIKSQEEPGNGGGGGALAAKPGFKRVKRAADSYLLYLLHRDLTSRFARRGVYTGTFGEHLEADLGDLGKRVTALAEEEMRQMRAEMEQEEEGRPADEAPEPQETDSDTRQSTTPSSVFAPTYRERNEPSRLFLIVVDAFSHLIFARGLSDKSGKTVGRALRDIHEEMKRHGFPRTLYTDNGSEFRAKPFLKTCQSLGLAHRLAKGEHKARLAERGVRTLKRIIMSAVQSGSWPQNQSWDGLVRAAAANANARYNRALKMSANEAEGKYWQMLKREWGRRNMETLREYTATEHNLRRGLPFTEGGKSFRIGQDVLLARPKIVRGKVKAKEFEWHYFPKPFELTHIFHAEKPALYKIRDPVTGQPASRLYYAKELLPVTLPGGLRGRDVVDYRVTKNNGLQYLVSRPQAAGAAGGGGRQWVKV